MNHAGWGNVDDDEQSGLLSETVIELAGCRIAIRHILYERGTMTKAGRAFLEREQPDVCIFGHTHQPKAKWFGETLPFNPGSPELKPFKLPRGIGLLHLRVAGVAPRLIPLPDQARYNKKLML